MNVRKFCIHTPAYLDRVGGEVEGAQRLELCKLPQHRRLKLLQSAPLRSIDREVRGPTRVSQSTTLVHVRTKSTGAGPVSIICIRVYHSEPPCSVASLQTSAGLFADLPVFLQDSMSAGPFIVASRVRACTTVCPTHSGRHTGSFLHTFMESSRRESIPATGSGSCSKLLPSSRSCAKFLRRARDSGSAVSLHTR